MEIEVRVCELTAKKKISVYDILRTHLLVNKRKFLAFLAARRKTLRIPRLPEDILG